MAVFEDGREWRVLTLTGLDLSKCSFTLEGKFSLDPTLFRESEPIRKYLDPEKQDPSSELTRAEIFDGACYSLQAGLVRITNNTLPAETERILRTQLAGILEAYLEVSPIEASRVISGQYDALREFRFQEQLRASGCVEAYERATNSIVDSLGTDIILFGEHGVEGAVRRGGLHALQGFIVLVESLINRAYQVASAKEQIAGNCAQLADFGVQSVRQNPFYVFLVSDSLNTDRSVKLPYIIVDAASYASDQNDAIRAAYEAALRELFPPAIFDGISESNGSSPYRRQANLISFMMSLSFR